jgi:hypothetical protein
MRDCGEAKDFEATVRRAFTRLTHDELPRAATARGWPVKTPEEFERLLLDHLSDEPGCAKPPCTVDLILAVELGERLLAGRLCCVRMSRRLRCAAARDPRRAEAFEKLLDILGQAGNA